METFAAENAKDEDGDNQRIGSRTAQTIATLLVLSILMMDRVMAKTTGV